MGVRFPNTPRSLKGLGFSDMAQFDIASALLGYHVKFLTLPKFPYVQRIYMDHIPSIVGEHH